MTSLRDLVVAILICALVLASCAPAPQTPPERPPLAPEPVACTQEAKQCPDGSYVSRVAPTCEFAPCPDE
ncbi:MAG: hypothetical protein AABY13_00100 [Nanoarchaeota archaeon]